MDELEQEERERQQRIKLNNRFANFVKLIEQQSERQTQRGAQSIEFDIPIEDLDFYGCPHKSVVKVRPTKYCLISISEFPFFVIDIDDIEVVCFERVQFGIKNFDMAIIFKDFTTMKRINSIPIEHIENVKEYLNDIGIIYAESVVNMNWTNVLQTVREDFEDFLENGCWKFLVEEDDDSNGGEGKDSGDEDSDGSFKEDDDDGEDEESDYDESDDDEDEDEDEDASSDFEEEEDLSEEGLSWDEMERQAEEEDRRAATRRVGKEAVPVPQKRGAAPPRGGRR
jgi:nucleosome binding factor SPN SPT16 subunit